MPNQQLGKAFSRSRAVSIRKGWNDMTSTTDRPKDQSTGTSDPDPSDTPSVDPVTGTTENATGEEQAAENEDRDPVG